LTSRPALLFGEDMIEITREPISPELVVSKVKTDSSGCVVTYIGLIREYSQGKAVLSVEYEDVQGTAEERLWEIAGKIRQKWQLNNVTICHRIGKLKVGDINLVVAIAAAHRQEGFAACQYAIDQFKQRLPTRKKEIYQDGSIWVEGG
jgi:molybdopterin synthase catalytic subunit